MNVGIIGAGAIATYLLSELQRKDTYPIDITSLLVRDKKKYAHLEKQFNVKLFTDIDEFLRAPIDIVVEAANVSAVKILLPKIVQKKDVVIISIGALADEQFLREIKSDLKKYSRKMYLPSGAIGGLDLVQNIASVGEIEKLTLETRKPAHTLIKEEINQEQVIFNGNAEEAIKRFPKNMNVSIALSLAGVGFKKTKVKMIADPLIENNLHTIRVFGEFGEATFSITNKPLENNPNTSYLAAISVLGTLTRLTTTIKIGH